MLVSLVIFFKVFFVLKVNINLQNMSIKHCLARLDQKTCIAVVFYVCAACLPASLIMHVSISELHVKWYYIMSLNSSCFLQFHPTVMLVAYVNSCFIIFAKASFWFLLLAESVKILVWPRAGFQSADIFSPATDFPHA